MAHVVNTVCGPVAGEELGKTLFHEHIIFGYPGFDGDVTLGGFDRKAALQKGIEVVEKAKANGVKTIVDATPNDCGRNPEFLKEISEQTGVNIVCSTGYYYEGEGAPNYFKFRNLVSNAEQEIYEMFIKEITEGIGNTGIKAGVIKLASSKNEITDYEKMFFRAGARAQRETGVPIITHTQEGTMGPEQAELLVAEGAEPSRILIGHMDGNTDVGYHIRVLQTGCSVGFDRLGIQGFVGMPMESEKLTVLLGLIAAGYEEQILLSHDTVNIWLGRPPVWPEQLAKLLENWHITHVFDNVIPQLMEKGVTEEQIDQIMVKNPARMFGVRIKVEV
ncbi:phosphotriesterase [Alicyclobacillus pomorum]|uniref:phosphotriesterase family protein n=1 Tax=Alicyclobacillus pomorum TaxID=204470 RepID=UPI000408143C|nr:phosphotriesterase-related protein [Alicyclobacillus pomorum]